jgi:oligopeptide transport system permease protein
MVSVPNRAAPVSDVVALHEHTPQRSLFADSLQRLARNRPAMIGGLLIVVMMTLSLLAPVIAPKPYDAAVLTDNNSAPTWVTRLFPTMLPKEQGGYVNINESYLLGADKLGRDLLSRLLYGSRISLAVAVVGPVISFAVGLLVGIVAGYVGGKVDNLLMRFVDVMYAFPTMLLIILMMTFFRTSLTDAEPGSLAHTLARLDTSLGGMFFIFMGIGLTAWMGMARLVRGQVLSLREKEYILSAQALGARTPWIMLRHVIPNILGPLIVAETLAIPSYISYEAFLSFIGLGVKPPMPSWGSMIAEGAAVIQTYPNQTIFPALALFLVMFAFNFLGDGLRDALDPRMRGVD